jgi:hypothetical protein
LAVPNIEIVQAAAVAPGEICVMSEVSSQASVVTAATDGPSFVTALCGFVSSMVAGAALVLLIVAL